MIIGITMEWMRMMVILVGFFCVNGETVFRAEAEAPGCDNNLDNGLWFVASNIFARDNCSFCV